MALTRPYRIGLIAVVIGGLVAGAVALSSTGAEKTEPAASKPGATDAATSGTTDAATPRATPAATAAPVAVDPGVQKQLAYVLAHWSDYNRDGYGVVDGNDCVNFTNQSLIERGWEMDDAWWTEGTGSDFTFSSPWVSSTALMRYIAESGRASALTDDQRDQVKVGDVAQFDWDNSGDRDHTGVVTRVEGSGDDIVIYYAGHTDDSDFLSVDFAITEKHPGATAYYWSIP